ncbi:nitroreductase family protein [Alistipes sp.]|uniref:nitroreductase family protein n=1 Tax=Alistipes sp. TaxID=1872444 RepID=UPI0023F2B48F|nr:nitroreductase family protein [Alistipes sp.]
MADDYLGRKMEEYMARKASGQSNRRPLATLGRLLLKNRSHRGYDTGFVVREDQLRRMIEVNTRIPSARNQQVLRFRPVLADEAHKVLPHIRLGGALPALRLPFPGTEPNAFIIICSTVEENRYVDMDLGISAQSMLLQAAEIGLNGICIGAFDKERIKQEFHLAYEPLLILAPHLLPRKRHALRPKTPRRRVDNQGMIRPSVHSTAFHHRPGRRTPVRGSSE